MRAIPRPIDVDLYPYAAEKSASGPGLVHAPHAASEATNQLKGKSLGCARSNETRGSSIAAFPASTKEHAARVKQRQLSTRFEAKQPYADFNPTAGPPRFDRRPG